jgi:hypothetical protein
MSFIDFINRFKPTCKLHSTGKSFCIITDVDIPDDFKKSLKYDELDKKIHWNDKAKCWFTSLDNEKSLLSNGISRTDLDNNNFDLEKETFKKEKEDFDLEKETFRKEREAFEKEKQKMENQKIIHENAKLNIKNLMKEYSTNKSLFEQEKEDFECEKKEYISQHQFLKKAGILVKKIKSLETEINNLKKIINYSDILSDDDISKIYITISSFIKFAYQGGILKGSDPNDNKAIHDIKLCYDKEKNLYLMKYQKMKNNELYWDYDPDAMYLPKLRK